jgi:hypothetical protein
MTEIAMRRRLTRRFMVPSKANRKSLHHVLSGPKSTFAAADEKSIVHERKDAIVSDRSVLFLETGLVVLANVHTRGYKGTTREFDADSQDKRKASPLWPQVDAGFFNRFAARPWSSR